MEKRKKNKYKMKRCILSAFLATVIISFAIAVPISATVVSVDSQKFVTESTFPLSVGFEYDQFNGGWSGSLYRDNPYILTTNIGGSGNDGGVYSHEYSQVDFWGTLEGQERQVVNYKCVDVEPIVYLDGDRFFPTDDDGNNYVNLGFRTYVIDFDGNVRAPSSGYRGTFDAIQSYRIASIGDVYFNPSILSSRNQGYDSSRWGLPYITMPDIMDYESLRYDMHYEYRATYDIIADNGSVHKDYSYGWTAQSIRDYQEDFLLLDVEGLKDFLAFDTICITNFRATIDVKCFSYDEQGEVWLPLDMKTYPDLVPSSYDKLEISVPFYNTDNFTDIDNLGLKYSYPNANKFVATYDEGDIVIPPTIDDDFNFLSWIINAVGGFMSLEIFPNFTLGGVLGVLVSFGLVLVLIRWLGGH